LYWRVVVAGIRDKWCGAPFKTLIFSRNSAIYDLVAGWRSSGEGLARSDGGARTMKRRKMKFKKTSHESPAQRNTSDRTEIPPMRKRTVTRLG